MLLSTPLIIGCQDCFSDYYYYYHHNQNYHHYNYHKQNVAIFIITLVLTASKILIILN